MDEPPLKKGKTDYPKEITDKKAVDSHVQAFLKAVLDHAQEYSSKKGDVLNKRICSKRDEWTQTDDSVIRPDELFVQSPLTDVSIGDLNVYPQHTDYGHLSLNNAFVNDKTQYYTDECEYVVPEDLTKATRVSSNKIRKAIDEWVKNYEDWFLENFGMDIRTASMSVNREYTEPVSSTYTQHSIPTVSDPSISTNTQVPHVLSSSAVSYIVTEGSLCIPNSQVCPYYSLVPSFYAPPTSSVPVLFNNSTQGSINSLINPFDQNQNLTFLNVSSNVLSQDMTTIPTCSSNTMSTALSIPSVAINENVYNLEKSVLNESKTLNTDVPTDFETSAMLAALALPILDSQNYHQWGPQLKYGTYGRLPSIDEMSVFQAKKINNGFFPVTSNNVENDRTRDLKLESKKMPPPPPTFLLLRRQAMVCALQISIRERGRDLFLREKENCSGISVNYIDELDHLVSTCISMKSVYVCAKLSDFNLSERCHYFKSSVQSTENDHTDDRLYDNNYCSNFYVCDLLIGDVLISASLSTCKYQAKMCCAKQAFKTLSNPCFLVGSVRCWEETEYLVLCLSPKAEIVPILPSFVCDPFEAFESDDQLDEKNTVVFNPKPMDDMWIYLANLQTEALDNRQFDLQILAQSAAFNQMTIVFDFEVHTDTGLFVCNGLIDNQVCITAESTTIPSVYDLAACQVIKWLRLTQPVVGLMTSIGDDNDVIDEEVDVYSIESDQILALWGISERVLINNLMWAKDELNMAIGFEQLEAHCDVPEFKFDSNNNAFCFETRFGCVEFLDHCLQSYAASALVTPLKICSSVVPFDLWTNVRQYAQRWGLLTCVNRLNLNVTTDGQRQLIVCKQIPMHRIKRSLFDNQKYGCFELRSNGNLSVQAQKRLFLADPLIIQESLEETNIDQVFSNHGSPGCCFGRSLSDLYADEPVTRLARNFIQSSVKNEPVDSSADNDQDSCILWSAELNQPSNAIEIIDDLPKTLIPGIDF